MYYSSLEQFSYILADPSFTALLRAYPISLCFDFMLNLVLRFQLQLSKWLPIFELYLCLKLSFWSCSSRYFQFYAVNNPD